MSKRIDSRCRNLIVVLGDQLNADSSAFDGFSKRDDVVWMAEVDEESTHVWSHKARIVLFLSAMRHFRDSLTKSGFRVDYQTLNGRGNTGSLAQQLEKTLKRRKPERVILVEPGEWRLKDQLSLAIESAGAEIEMRTDRHFFATPEEFAEHAEGRKQLRLEYFYRELRRKHDVLMNGKEPVGGKWNYDADNRGSFGKSGPDNIPPPKRFRPDSVTREVIELVEKRFSKHPGSLEHFDWPVTPRQAAQSLEVFIEHRLPFFGEFQDAMWTDEPYLHHSRISSSLNLKLIDPRVVVDKAVEAYQGGAAELNNVEGFVRQILGWREYVRGIYWMMMPEYIDRNALKAAESLPDFYWTGETDMRCLEQAIGQTMKYGYAHHIQRLMVTGLFGMLFGVDPKQMHQWYLAVYVDAVEWVELPNTLGMSQYADGGVMASKPYAATGKYIQRMSNYCAGCKYNPAKSVGDDACPFTTLYWDFLDRHQQSLSKNQRMSLQVKNLDRKSHDELAAIREQATQVRDRYRVND